MNVVEYMVNEVTRLAEDSVSMIPAPLYCLVMAEIKSASAIEAFLRDDHKSAYGAVAECLINQVLTGIEYIPSFLDSDIRDKPLKLEDLVKLNSDVSRSLKCSSLRYPFSVGVRQAIAILGTTTVQQVEKHIKLL